MFKTKIINPLMAVVKQGITPEKLALSLSLGMAISISPLLFGFTTFLCAIVAGVFKLNQVAIQVANYIVYPLQLILIVPFMKFGEKIFSNSNAELTVEMLKQSIAEGPRAFFSTFGSLFLYGTIAWIVAAPFIAGALYLSLFPICKHLIRKYNLK